MQNLVLSALKTKIQKNRARCSILSPGPGKMKRFSFEGVSTNPPYIEIVSTATVRSLVIATGVRNEKEDDYVVADERPMSTILIQKLFRAVRRMHTIADRKIMDAGLPIAVIITRHCNSIWVKWRNQPLLFFGDARQTIHYA